MRRQELKARKPLSPLEVLSQVQFRGNEAGDVCPYCRETAPDHTASCEIDRTLNVEPAGGGALFTRETSADVRARGCFACANHVRVEVTAAGAPRTVGICGLFLAESELLKKFGPHHFGLDAAGNPPTEGTDVVAFRAYRSLTAEACGQFEAIPEPDPEPDPGV